MQDCGFHGHLSQGVWNHLVTFPGDAFGFYGSVRRVRHRHQGCIRAALPEKFDPNSAMSYPTESTILQRAWDHFLKRFGSRPQQAAAAPGRINVMGDHVDYCGGLVLPMALEQVTFVCGKPIKRPEIQIYSALHDQLAVLPLHGGRAMGCEFGWTRYVQGIVAGFRNLGLTLPGFQAVIDSSVPLGAGLSSSAALEISLATFLEALIGHTLDPWGKARLGQRAEHDFAGVPCGLMDQMASVFGRKGCLLLFDCELLTLEYHDFPADSLSVLALDTGIRHELGASEYALRRADCENAVRLLQIRSLRHLSTQLLEENRHRLEPIVHRRVRHVVGEIERTRRTAEALAHRDWEACRRWMAESHRSLRDDFEVSCRELDAVVEAADQIGLAGGVIGCRMTGGGFGGSCIALVDTQRSEEVQGALEKGYEERTGNRLRVLRTQPGDGARRIEVTHESDFGH